MRKITINSIEYNVPTSWQECTLKQAIKVQDYELQEDEYKILAIIAGYSNIELEELKHFKLDEIRLLTDAMKFVLEPLPEEPISQFTFKGHEYFTIESFMTQESQDYFTTEAIMKAHGNNTYKALPELLAVMCKRERETLDSYKIQDRAKLFEDLPMDICEGLRLFFYAIAQLSAIRTQSFLQRDQIIAQKASETRSMLNTLDGGRWSGILLAKILRKYLKSLERNWKTYSSGIASNSKV